MRKLVVIFCDKDYFQGTRTEIEPSCGKGKEYPTTSFNNRRLSMTIRRGEIVDPYAIGIGCLQLGDSGQGQRGQMTLDISKIKSVNGRKVESFAM
ncbi:hypothetical protein AMJ47_03490 [Parcubacteria bacterium DG_72]|nr:MAG: hypothetical protein AMJ47_03490 [Parcubacteria bacterium DG_72]